MTDDGAAQQMLQRYVIFCLASAISGARIDGALSRKARSRSETQRRQINDINGASEIHGPLYGTTGAKMATDNWNHTDHSVCQ